MKHDNFELTNDRIRLFDDENKRENHDRITRVVLLERGTSVPLSFSRLS